MNEQRREIVAWCMACGMPIEEERLVQRRILKTVLDKQYEAVVCRHHPERVFETLQEKADEWARSLMK